MDIEKLRKQLEIEIVPIINYQLGIGIRIGINEIVHSLIY